MSFSIYTHDDTDRDYSVGADGRLLLVIDADTVVERIRTRLNTWLSDWYLDTSRGIDYKNKILGKSRNGGEVSSILRREILSEPGVLRIDSFALTQDVGDPRGFSVSAEVTLLGSSQTTSVNL